MFYKAGPLFLVIILLVVISFSTAGCTCDQDKTAGSSNEDIEILSEDIPSDKDIEVLSVEDIPTVDKGNPKLSSHLKQLISAEEQGEAEELAGQQKSIKLVDGSVKVTIECEPGQADTVAKAASALGIVELSILDLVQVVVPITSLTALANIPGVRFIRLPWYPEESEEAE